MYVQILTRGACTRGVNKHVSINETPAKINTSVREPFEVPRTKVPDTRE